MACGCEFEPTDAEQRGVLVRLLAVNAVMFGVEIVVGLLADSTGVLADSLDMLADALVYGIAYYAVGRHSAVKQRAARGSGWFQIALALTMAAEVVRRGVMGSEPESALMFGVSVVAFLANAYCLRLLARHRDGEVHLRASWIFTRSDVIANAGVIVAAGLVAWLDHRWPDLVVGAAICAVVISGGIAILRDAGRPDSRTATSGL